MANTADLFTTAVCRIVCRSIVGPTWTAWTRTHVQLIFATIITVVTFTLQTELTASWPSRCRARLRIASTEIVFLSTSRTYLDVTVQVHRLRRQTILLRVLPTKNRRLRHRALRPTKKNQSLRRRYLTRLLLKRSRNLQTTILNQTVRRPLRRPLRQVLQLHPFELTVKLIFNAAKVYGIIRQLRALTSVSQENA